MVQQLNLKQAARVSLFLFFCLLTGAFIFYRERLLLDATYISFRIINTGSLQIQVERYGSFITQIVPLLASKWHLPLRAVLIAYTVSFNVFYLCGALILYALRQYALVILMALYFSLYVSDTYFWTNNELHQGICWMFLMFGYMNYARDHMPERAGLRLLYYIGVTALSVLSIYTHPIIMVPLVFLWGCAIIERKRSGLNAKDIVIHSLLFVCVVIFKYVTSTKNYYDGGLLQRLERKNIYDVLEAFTSGLAQMFAKGSIFNYWIFPLLFFAGMVVLFLKRKFLLLSWVIVFNLALFVALCFIFPGGGPAFHMESEFMPFAILGCYAFVNYIIPVIKSPRTVVLMMVSIFLVRLAYIGNAGILFHERLVTINKLVLYMKNRNLAKMIITEDSRLEQALIQSWALPMESLYASMLLDGTARTVAHLNEARANEFAKEKSLFVDPFGSYPIADLHQHGYFLFDSTSQYTVLHYDDVFDHGAVRK